MLHPHHRVRLLRPQLSRAARAGDRPPRRRRRRRTCPASACGRCARGRSCSRPARSSGRWCSPATTGRASCWRARCAAISTAMQCAPGRRAVVLTNNDSAYRTALDLHARRGRRSRVVDLRAASLRARLPARGAGPPASSVLAGHAITATRGHRRVARSRCDGSVASRDGQVEGAGGAHRLAISWRLRRLEPDHPSAIAVARAARATTTQRALFLPGAPVQAERSAGACNGAFTLAACLEEGARAGVDAAAAAGFTAELPELPRSTSPRRRPRSLSGRCRSGRPLPARARRSSTCRTTSPPPTSRLALREGYRSVEHVKRYTTTGMGTDQGKTSNVNALGIVAAIDRPDRSPRSASRPSARPIRR